MIATGTAAEVVVAAAAAASETETVMETTGNAIGAATPAVATAVAPQGITGAKMIGARGLTKPGLPPLDPKLKIPTVQRALEVETYDTITPPANTDEKSLCRR